MAETKLIRPGMHQEVREKLDPDSLWMTDDEIQRIIRICPTDNRRIVHKCLLSLYYKAQKKRDRAAIGAARLQLSAFEDGRLVVF